MQPDARKMNWTPPDDEASGMTGESDYGTYSVMPSGDGRFEAVFHCGTCGQETLLDKVGREARHTTAALPTTNNSTCQMARLVVVALMARNQTQPATLPSAPTHERLSQSVDQFSGGGRPFRRCQRITAMANREDITSAGARRSAAHRRTPPPSSVRTALKVASAVAARLLVANTSQVAQGTL
jgi:hypothetical protein